MPVITVATFGEMIVQGSTDKAVEMTINAAETLKSDISFCKVEMVKEGN
jgi:hypothetical protein